MILYNFLCDFFFQEIFTCKQLGCGKIFTNQDEFRTHEALEELKIRFMYENFNLYLLLFNKYN